MEENSFSNTSQASSSIQGMAMKKCPNCGSDNKAYSVFCEYCGSRIDTPTQMAANMSTSTAAASEGKLKAPFANGSLICSIIGLGIMSLLVFLPDDTDEIADLFVGFVVLGGLALSILGMVFGIVGSKMIKGGYNAYSDSSKLVVGKTLGIIGLVLWSVIMTLGMIMILAEEGIEGLIY